MELITIDHLDQVALVRLNHGVTNKLTMQLLEELGEALQAAQVDPEVQGLVLASANDKFFSIGFDIPGLFELSRDDFTPFYQAFNRTCLDLFTFPKPTAAAITGHAIAGGCILALCCDYRYIAEGRKLMGLNEIRLGVPVPYVADCILRQLIGARQAREVLELGEFYQSVDVLRLGMVDSVLPLERVLETATEKVKKLGSFPQPAFAVIKRNRVEPVEAEIRARLAEREQAFIECWFSDVAREKLKAVMEKF